MNELVKSGETDIRIFENSQFGEIRTVEVNGKPYFVGNDVAKALGYKRPKDAVSAHCKGAAIHRLSDNQGVIRETKIIPEGDVYRLMAKSELPGAEAFESWIFDEVLPAIWRQGYYATPQKNEELKQLLEANEENRRQISELTGKVNHYMLATEDSLDSILSRIKGVNKSKFETNPDYREFLKEITFGMKQAEKMNPPEVKTFLQSEYICVGDYCDLYDIDASLQMVSSFEVLATNVCKQNGLAMIHIPTRKGIVKLFPEDVLDGVIKKSLGIGGDRPYKSVRPDKPIHFW
jgi:prophage antirepressor-like protein